MSSSQMFGLLLEALPFIRRTLHARYVSGGAASVPGHPHGFADGVHQPCKNPAGFRARMSGTALGL